MSGEKATSPCNKFQANIFNKSKCQNCFKSRELHLLNDHDLEQAKPIYAGWLCLAPEGTDFDNPMQRSRKWQRRFFILYEHGSLTFALDELRSTLPQGTVNLNQCSEISDAEPRTGQRNALCIATTEQEIFIRGDNKEIINGWSEQLVVYPRTNKQNQKKKRKVEPFATQEPCPAKMAATDPCFPSVAVDICGRWQEEQRGRGPAVTPMWPPGSQQTPTGNTSPYLSPVSSCDSLASDSFLSPVESLDLVANGNSDPITNNRLAQSDNTQTAAKNKNQTRDESLLGLEATEEEQTAVSRKGRSEARTSKHEKLQSCGDIATLTAPAPQRRAKSLDRRTSDTVMTPDLLNFKKGWMVKLNENEQWKKYWFVLSTDSLRYYKDSIAEEASDLEGEIDLTKCYNVSEFQVQRNYGFQIHTPKAVYTLSAMTAGIRRNWIQALMKNVHPANAPDVASLPGHLVPCISPPESLPKPDVTRDSPSADVSIATDPHPKHRSVMERRREGRYKTFDWTEFRPQKKKTTTIDSELQNKSLSSSAELQNKSLCTLELGDVERRQRREERRKRYEGMLGFSLGWDAVTDKSEIGSVRALSPKSQQRVEEEIEECWKLVEKTVFRLETNVPPMFTEDKETEETETELVNYRNRVEDLKAELAESELRRLALEAQLSTAGYYQQQLDPPLSSDADFCPLYANEKPLSNGHTQTLTDKNPRELLQQQNSIGSETPSLTTPTIWLHDTEGNFKELGETVTTPLSSPALDIQNLFCQGEGQNVELPLDVATTNHQNQHVPSSETLMNNCEYTPLILEKPANGDDITLSCCEENHTLDQAAYQTVVRRLSQEVELLSNQNEALNQRNQEMLNQLTEADREIERLKSELSSRYSEPCHLPEVEQMEQTRVDDVERELSLSNERLLEARGLITSLEENLRETEALLLLNVQTDTQEKSEVAEEEDGYLLQCLEAAETKLTIDQSEQTCYGEIQSQSPKLTETDTLHLQTAADADTNIMRLNQELEKDMLQDGESNGSEEKIQKVIEGMGMRFRALGKLLEVIDKFDIGLRKEEESEEKWLTMPNQLKWEQEFWKCLLDKLESNTLEFDEEKAIGGLLNEVTERMIVEKQMLLVGCGLLPDTDTSTDEVGDGLKDLDIFWDIANCETETRKMDGDDSRILDFNDQPCEIKHFRAITETKISLLNLLASSVSTSAHDKLQLISDKLSNINFSEHPKSGFIHSAATEALYCAHISRLRSKYEKELESTKQTLLNSTLICSNCVNLMEENRELREKLSKLEELQSLLLIEKMNVCCQTEESDTQDTDTELQGEYESVAGEIVLENAQQAFETAEEMVESIEFDCKVEVESQLANQEVVEEKTVPSSETVQVLVLRRRVTELEDQLIVIMTEMEEEHDGRMSSVQTQHEEEIEKLQLSCAHGLALMEEAHLKILAEMQEQLIVMKEEHDGKMSSVQMQHEKDMEKVKLTCERGLALMEESHVKVVEELQRRHTQDIQRLLLDRDTLLEEESAATATAIQAIKNAHQLELEREVERRHSTGNTHLDDVYRQHSEELASFQRELQALSQQFSLKCLENSHLVQAVEAERKALCQCQQENQDLRTRNQELSGHLAAEITRLFSLAKQDALPLSQGMDVYEMEITLRVKESEVQCLKQEITSLKDELQSAQKDKRNATKKYKDVYTELSITRAKSEQEVDELRENLRLVHRALDQTSL